MLKWIAGIAVGLVWCVIIFFVTWYLTFPSQAVVDRAAFEVQKASNGSYALKASSASPWWAGVTLHDVVLMSVDEAGKGQPVLLADDVSARTAVGSLIGGGLPVHAVINLGGSPITVDAELDRSQNPPKLTAVDAEAPELTLSALSAILAPLGARMSGDGALDLSVDLEIGDKVDDHDGRMKITGKDLKLSMVVPDPISGGDFKLDDIEVSEIELVMDVKNGQAELRRGTIHSSLATIDVDLSATLNERFGRTRLSGTMVVSDLGGDLAMFESAFQAARWDDGKFHYRIACAVDRLSGSCVRPDSQPRSRTGGSTLPDPGDIRDRMERNRTEVPPPVDRGSATGSATRSPSTNRSAANDRGGALDDDMDDEPLDDDMDDEPMDDEEEYDDLPPPVNAPNVDLIDPSVTLPPDMTPRMERELNDLR